VPGRKPKELFEETIMTGDPPGFALAICGCGRVRGQIAIAGCPGRSTQAQLPYAAERLLQRDVATVARWGASAVVTLLDSLEMARLRLQALPSMLAHERIAWHHLPLDPRQVPNPSFEQSWSTLSAPLATIVREGGRVVVHCRDGRARAGLVAALLLVELGSAPQDAINRVRAARPGTLDLAQQEEYVRAHKPVRTADLYQLDLLETIAPATEPAAVDGQMVAGTVQPRFAQHR
jgi:ADP-ribosyl-[dinitrogen reductase] hydrolase